MSNLKICKEISISVFSILILAGCGAGSVASYNSNSGSGNGTSPNPGPNPAVTTAVTLSVTPAVVAYNSTAVITWSSTNSTSCTSSPSGINNTAGSYTTPPLTSDTIYTVTCNGATGKASKSVTISIAGASIVNATASCVAEPMRGTEERR